MLARLGGQSHGVVTRTELLAAGVSRAQIQRCLRNGGLLPEHPGVYRVGHRAPSLEARYLAAVKAAGDDALVSGRAAGYLLGILDGPAPQPEVTAPRQRRLRGVRTRRARGGLHPDDATTRRGIPVTSPPRTLVDLAPELDRERLARACHEAGVRYGTSPRQVAAVLERRPRSPGAGDLRRILTGDEHVTLSALERRFLHVLRDNALPLPVTNRAVGGRRVDCRWPEYRLTVELDGYRYHRSRHAWEQDRRREREAHARGDEFRRYTYGDVLEEPRLMIAELRDLIPPKRPAR